MENNNLEENPIKTSETAKVMKPVSIIIGIIVGIIILATIFIVIAFTVFKTIKKENTTKNEIKTNQVTANISEYQGQNDIQSTTQNNEEYETEHTIEGFNLKFKSPEDMLILTKNEIEQYMGTGYSNFYEIVSMDNTGEKLLYVFFDKATNLSDYTEEEYIKKSLENTPHSDPVKVIIGGKEFTKVQAEHNDEEGNYIEECYVCKGESNFLCIDFWRLSTTEIDLTQFFEKME